MFYHRYSGLWHIACLILGPGLIFNSIRGLMNREGMYDEGSTSQMTLAGWLGIIVGIGMTLYGLSMFLPLLRLL